MSSRPAHAVASDIAFWLAVLGILLLAVEQVERIGDFRIDDAYITFSFSKNLALGNGPVYSHGLRVEGYSNFLWMLLVVPAFWVAPESDGYTWSRVLAFLLLALGLFLSYKLARRASGRFYALLAPASIVACSDVLRATLSGLETIPYAVAILFGWWVYLREPPHQRRWSLLAFLPAALLRIDGFVPLLIVVGFEVLQALLEARLSFRRLLIWAAPAVAIWCSYFAWRYAYYGLPLPTTYYAKALVDSHEPGRGFNQVWAFLRDYGALAMLPLMALPIVRGPRRDALGLATAVVAYFVYAGLTGGDWMPFQRFFLPAVPLAAVLAAWGAARLKDETRRSPMLARAGTFALVALAYGFFGVHAHMARVDTALEREKLEDAARSKHHVNEDLLPGMDLARHIIRRPGEKLVSDYAGVFAMFTEAEVIDMWGLCNELIALKGDLTGINPIFGKTCPSCYAALAPDYFHVNVPLVRESGTFRSAAEVISEIFQSDAIDAVIDMRNNFAAGRVVDLHTDRAVWFIERRRPGASLAPRMPAPGVRVDYPFERARATDT